MSSIPRKHTSSFRTQAGVIKDFKPWDVVNTSVFDTHLDSRDCAEAIGQMNDNLLPVLVLGTEARPVKFGRRNIFIGGLQQSNVYSWVDMLLRAGAPILPLVCSEGGGIIVAVKRTTNSGIYITGRSKLAIVQLLRAVYRDHYSDVVTMTEGLVNAGWDPDIAIGQSLWLVFHEKHESSDSTDNFPFPVGYRPYISDKANIWDHIAYYCEGSIQQYMSKARGSEYYMLAAQKFVASKYESIQLILDDPKFRHTTYAKQLIASKLREYVTQSKEALNELMEFVFDYVKIPADSRDRRLYYSTTRQQMNEHVSV